MGTTLDDELLRDFFGTDELRAIFDARARLQAWLDTERALAETQAELGIVPADAAARIAAACDAEQFNLDELRAGINATQHPIVPVVHALEARLGEHAGYVHFGATTQDIMDTGQVLQVRAALEVIARDLAGAIAAAARLADEHRATPQAGRTHAQQAVPISFGLKAATWLDELTRAAERIAEARPRILAAQIGGAAGTLAAYGESAREVKAGVARRLGLGDPAVPWHVARDRVADLGAITAALANAAERVAAEVIRLQATELQELAEPLQEGHIGSSTMPQKRNPHVCEGLVAKARIARAAGGALLANGAHLHERDMGAWAVEWVAVPQALITCGGIVADLRFVLEGLKVRADRMRTNLDRTGGQIVAERLMMALAPAIGRDRAHDLLIELTRAADAQGRPFSEVAAADPRVAEHLSADEVTAALDPVRYVGIATDLIDGALAQADGTLNGSPAGGGD